MIDKKEAIAKIEEKKHREKEATCNQFFDLTKKAIEVEESMAKAKAIEAEAKMMAEEREIMLVDTTNMTEGQKAWGEEASCHHPTTQRMIKHYLHKLPVSIINIMHSLFLLVRTFG
jgi:hypothetical protein